MGNNRLISALVALGMTASATVGMAQKLSLSDVREELTQLGATIKGLDNTYLKQAMQEDANRFAARMNEGQFFFYAKEYDRAAMVMWDLVDTPSNRSQPGFRDAVYFLAESLYLLRNYEACRPFFEQAYQIGSREQKVTSIARLLEMSLDLDDRSSGRRYVSMASSLLDGGDTPYLLYTLGKYHAENNELDTSARYLSQVTGASFDALRAQYYLGVVRVRQGRLSDAIQPFQTVANSQKPEDISDGRYQDLRSEAWLGLARLAYERSDFANAVDYYNQVSTQTKAFDDAMHEMVWIAVKQGDYDNALRKLDLLLISQPDVLKGPEARLLEGKLTLMKQDYKGARKAFEALSVQFGAIKTEMTSIEAAHPDLEAHFGTVVGDRIAEFDLRSVLPAKAVVVAGDSLGSDRDLQVVNDVAAQRRDMESAKRTVEKLDIALSSENRAEMFPQIHAGLLKAIELKATLTQMRATVNDIDGRAYRRQNDTFKALQSQRREVGLLYAKIPRTVARMKERDARIDRAMAELDLQMHTLRVEVGSIESQLLAMGKYLDDTGGQKGSDRIRISLESEKEAALSVLKELEELNKSIEDERQKVGVNDYASRQDDQVEARFRLLIQKEGRTLVQYGVTGGQSLREQAEALETECDRFIARSQRIVDRRVKEFKRILVGEKQRIRDYENNLSRQEKDTEKLGGAIAARTFRSVMAKVHNIVLEADFGLVHVSWKRKKDKTDARRRALKKQTDELRRLRSLFDEARRE